jgi:predicted phosphodiesterase
VYFVPSKLGQELDAAVAAATATPAELKDAELVELAERRGYIIHKPQPSVRPVVDIDTSRIRGKRVRIAVISDTHFGSKYQQSTHLRRFLEYARKVAKVSMIVHCGDVTDGPFSRHKNPQEVWLHTFPSMVEYASSTEALPELGIPYKIISGNHDDWYLDGGGPDVVREICNRRDDFEYLGPVGAFLRFGDVVLEMMHPNMGGAYALSYNLQKHIEGMPPEEKPHIYLAGNFHKALHLPGYRNVEGFLVPAYQSRSHWMRGKRLASVVGGIILEFGIVPKGLAVELDTHWEIERVPLNDDWPGGRPVKARR